MKKNAVIIASIAWLTILTTATAFSFADTGNNVNNAIWKAQNRMMQNKWWFGWMERWWFKGKMGIGSWAGMRLNQNMQAMKDAITKNDYNAYLTAYENGKMTQAQFDQVVAMGQSKQGIDTAITNNDYTAYLAAIKGTPMEGKVTQAQFISMVTKQQQRIAMNSAITNNDYTAYLAAIKWTPKEGKVTQAQFTAMVQHIQQEPTK